LTAKKRNTPSFVRQESWRYLRVKTPWRRPRGKNSKTRLGKRGWPKIVKIGYRHALGKRGFHPSGLEEVIVRRPADLEGIDAKSKIIIISHTVGERNRIAVMDRAQALELKVANPKAKKTETTPASELVVKDVEPRQSEEESVTTGAKIE
jgi:large subunit ribosomal protein L32e